VVRTEELNGLKPQVQVDPVTLTIVILPPILPLLPAVVLVAFDALVVLLVFELPPQAATSMATAANDTIHLQRLIDILIPSRRSPATGWL
jgi:hypothetical protein